MGDLHSSATSEYNGHIIQLRNAALKSAQDIFIDKCYARVRIHQIAIKELTDAGLRAKLTADLVDFARELVGTQLSKLEIAIRVNGIIDIALEPLFDLRTIIQALVVGPSKVKPEVQLKTINENIAKFMEAVFEYRESAELLLSKKDELLSDLEGQLQKTNEPSLALTLALVIIHAKLSYGVLKASG